jgi:transcriptional regulator with XRE-family HTH domain
MNSHGVFAENLRKVCYQHPSISAVCSGVGINRQQFNKYLAGQSMPNSATLRKICDFLNTNERDLFSPDADVAHQCMTSRKDIAGPSFDRASSVLAMLQHMPDTGTSLSANIMQPGYYDCYFPLQNSELFIMKSLVKITIVENQTHFSRLTKFPAKSGSRKYLARGKHVGLVISNLHEVYFVGVSRSPPHHMSFLAFGRENTGNTQFLSGVASVRTGTSQFVARTCMRYIGQHINSRKCLTELGPVGINDASLDSFVRIVMTVQPTRVGNQISAVGVESILPETAPNLVASLTSLTEDCLGRS